ncbi:unnamed protein product [Closterium sp. Naga37s-1]|nr:unnamed protein product [Closterium sp. Naga37s-1]
MGCTWSGLTAIYDAVSSGEEVKVNGRRFRIVQNLGEGGYAFVYLVRETGSSRSSAVDGPDALSDPAADVETSGDVKAAEPRKSEENAGFADDSDVNPAVPAKPKRKYVSPDNTYALKKFLIQTKEQLLLVKAEIDVASKLDHPSLLPLVEHAIVSSKQQQGTKEAYLVFPVYRDGTIHDHVGWMAQPKGSQPGRGHRFSPLQVLTIISQVAAGLAHMHACSPPLAHNDVKPGNILIAFGGGHGATGGLGGGMSRGSGDGICVTGVAERDDAFVAGLRSGGGGSPPAGGSSGSGAFPAFPSAAGAAAAAAGGEAGEAGKANQGGRNGGGEAAGGAGGAAGGEGAGERAGERAGEGLPLERLPTASASDVAVAIMDFGSTTPARRHITSRNQALSLQEWAAQHCSAAYRAPEFWDCPSEMDIDERSDVWSLGCTLYATMYGQSPFEFSLGESGGSLQLAVMSGTIKWPHPPLSASSSSPSPALMDAPGSSGGDFSGFSAAGGAGGEPLKSSSQLTRIVALSAVFCFSVPLKSSSQLLRIPLKSSSQLLRIVALSAVFCFSVVGGNTSLRFIPVSFNQAIGATTPFFTAVFAYLLTFKREAALTYAALLPVVLGVVIASGSEPSFHLFGFIICVSATAARALKSVLQGLLLQSDGHQLNSMNLLFYMAPIAVLLLLPATLVIEPTVLAVAASKAHEDWGIIPLLLVNSSTAFFVNLTNFLVTRYTSALTLQVLSHSPGTHTLARFSHSLHVLSVSMYPHSLQVLSFSPSMLGTMQQCAMRCYSAPFAVRFV